MSENKDWWNCKQAKTALELAPETAVSAFFEEIGLEYNIVRKDIEIEQKPEADEKNRQIWRGYGGHIIFAQVPYIARALVVVNMKDLGELFFMFEGDVSIAFKGDRLNPARKQKSALGVASALRGVQFAKQFKDKVVSIANFKKIETGSIQDHPNPRGVGYSVSNLGDTQWNIFSNQDDPEAVTFENPLLSLLNREFQMHNKSKIYSSFHKSEMPKYLQVNPRGSKTILSVGSTQPLQVGAPSVITTELKDFDNQWYIVVVPQPSLIKLNFETLRQLSEISRIASTDYEVYSGALDSKDQLPRYLAIEMERQQTLSGDEPINLHELSDDAEDSRAGQIVGYLTEREPSLLWPKRLECTNCKAVYNYQATDSKSGYLECKNCLRQFPVN